MTEPVSDGEIEDVLSSIRRLISDDSSRRIPEPKVMDRFVLTPALRVLDDDPDESGESDLAAPTKRSVPRDIQQAVTATARSELEARIAELEAAVSRSREEWEPDGSEPDAGEMPERHIFAHTATEEPQREEPWSDEPDQPEPTETEATEPEPTPTFRRDRAQANIPQEQDSEGAVAQDRSEATGRGVAVVDDEVLKELVTQVVRQELQGAMGERITRNVRRMVRREIQQALALKDFE